MDEYQPTCKFDIAETCAASISIQDLIDLSDNKEETAKRLSLTNLKLTYGHIRGTDALRNNLAALYSARASGVTKGVQSTAEVLVMLLMADHPPREYSDHEWRHCRQLSGAVHVGPGGRPCRLSISHL